MARWKPKWLSSRLLNFLFGYLSLAVISRLTGVSHGNVKFKFKLDGSKCNLCTFVHHPSSPAYLSINRSSLSASWASSADLLNVLLLETADLSRKTAPVTFRVVDVWPSLGSRNKVRFSLNNLVALTRESKGFSAAPHRTDPDKLQHGLPGEMAAEGDFLVNNAQVKKWFLNGPRPDTLAA